MNNNTFTLPKLPKPLGIYSPFRKVNNQVYISGQLPISDGKIVADIQDTNDFIFSAEKQLEVATLNLIAQAASAVNSEIKNIKSCIRINIYIVCPNNFTDHSSLANTSSGILNNFFPEADGHARTTIGVHSLPLGSLVEVDGIFEMI